MKCLDCGDGRAHHAVADPDDEGCWGPTCMTRPTTERCRSWRPEPAVERNVAPVGHGHPATALEAAAKVLPRTGSIRREVYDQIARRQGLTDDELEQITMRSHQTVSAARNTLAGDRLIVDSGETRPTRYGNRAIVWKVAPT